MASLYKSKQDLVFLVADVVLPPQDEYVLIVAEPNVQPKIIYKEDCASFVLPFLKYSNTLLYI